MNLMQMPTLIACLTSAWFGQSRQRVSAGTAIVDGIAASAYTTLEEYGVVLDAVASQRFEHSVRVHSRP